MTRGVLLLCLLMACAGCGQSGDLFLPTPREPAAAPQTAPETEREPAAATEDTQTTQEQDEDDEETPAG